jgi:nucleoside-diphosphate-sugar epimerase
MPALLRRDDGRAVVAAGAVLPDAHGRLFRGDRRPARHCLAVFGLAVAARFSAAGEPRAPVGYIVEKLARHWDAATWRMADGKQPHKAVHLKMDASKAQVRLGWHPRLAADLALDWTAAWYRKQQDGASARDLCLDQIQRYQKHDGR